MIFSGIRGKLSVRFPLLFFLILLKVQFVSAQEPGPLIVSLMNFPHVGMPQIDDIRDQVPEFVLDKYYGDLYRKRINAQQVLGWSDTGTAAGAFWPLRAGKYSLSVRARYQGYQGDFENHQDRTAVGLHYQSSGKRSAATFALTDGAWLGGFGFEGAISSFHAPVKIKAFPTTTNLLIGQLFLNWLEPTFGRTIDMSGTSNYSRPSIFVALPVGRGKQLSLFFTHTDFNFLPSLIYTNSSNKPALTGERKMDVRFRTQENVIALGMKQPDAGWSFTAALFNADIMLEIDNNPPPANPVKLDFDILGNLTGGRRGLSLQISKESDAVSLLLGLGRSYYDAKFDMRTPVLGYYLKILPISHGVTGKVSGESLSQRIHGVFNSRFMGAHSIFGLGYIHTRYQLTVAGEGQMAFNLVSVPINYPLVISQHLIQLHIQIGAGKGPLRWRYVFDQYIPFSTRVDDSPILIVERPPGLKLSHRGGGIHRLFLIYSWI